MGSALDDLVYGMVLLSTDNVHTCSWFPIHCKQIGVGW